MRQTAFIFPELSTLYVLLRRHAYHVVCIIMSLHIVTPFALVVNRNLLHTYTIVFENFWNSSASAVLI